MLKVINTIIHSLLECDLSSDGLVGIITYYTHTKLTINTYLFLQRIYIMKQTEI